MTEIVKAFVRHYTRNGTWPRFLFHVACLLPVLWLVWDFSQHQLTANPIREIQLRTGRYALIFLVASLAGTPLYRLFGIRLFWRLRRPLGLYSFAYASLHLLNFVAVDYGFNMPLIRADIFDKRYAVAGFAAYLVLLALAITSTQGWRNRLGNSWQRLHRSVYAAACLVVIHFLLQVRVDRRTPLLYGGVLLVLLLLRIPGLIRARQNQTEEPP